MNIGRPTCPEVAPLANEIYARHSAGCCLHIVLDDDNIKDSDVQFCLDQAKERGHADCEKLAVLLLSMSKTQRLKMGEYIK